MKVDFFFEQDCTQDANRYYNWFLFKVPVSALIAGNIDKIPELVVTFGDKDGDLKAHAMAVD